MSDILEKAKEMLGGVQPKAVVAEKIRGLLGPGQKHGR